MQTVFPIPSCHDHMQSALISVGQRASLCVIHGHLSGTDGSLPLPQGWLTIMVKIKKVFLHPTHTEKMKSFLLM